MFIPRSLQTTLRKRLKTSNKAILLYGARQIGKTTLVQNLIKDLPYKTLSINADEKEFNDVLSSRSFAQLKGLVSGYDLLVIDEAQRIRDIGLNLKILIDRMPNLKIIATGSSSFELANKVQEPLTGRHWSYVLYPISYYELQSLHTPFELKNQLETRLIYGSYPEIFLLKNNEEKNEYLKTLCHSYLYKDVLELSSIKHAYKIDDLLKLIAFQVGSEVSLSELGSSLDMARETVEHYIDLLEKSFVLFRLHGLSRNLRKEVRKMDKIYFYDLGIRNAILDNFKALKDRNDIGMLWENFLVLERLKYLEYTKTSAGLYFWRVHTGAELDYVEERGGVMHGYEFKVKAKSHKAPSSWKSAYPDSSFKLIHMENFVDFVT